MVTSVHNRALVLVVSAAHQAEKMMATTTKTTDYDDYADQFPQPTKLFDVTCVIGTVYAGVHGDMTPRQVAYMMIVDHNAEGTFSFPMEDGGIEHVTVDRERENPS